MINPSIPQPDWPYYKSEYDAGRMSQDEIGEKVGVTQGAVSRRFKRMDKAAGPSEPASKPGEPTTALQRVEYIGEPSGEPGLPDIARQSDLDNLKIRIEVLETFIATLQQQQTPIPGSPNGSPVVHPVHSGSPNGSPVVHPVHSGSPNGSPTHKRGFVLADDLWDAIHTYAEAHHVQIAQVVDVALRTFFAAVAEEVAADA